MTKQTKLAPDPPPSESVPRSMCAEVNEERAGAASAYNKDTKGTIKLGAGGERGSTVAAQAVAPSGRATMKLATQTLIRKLNPKSVGAALVVAPVMPAETPRPPPLPGAPLPFGLSTDQRTKVGSPNP